MQSEVMQGSSPRSAFEENQVDVQQQRYSLLWDSLPNPPPTAVDLEQTTRRGWMMRQAISAPVHLEPSPAQVEAVIAPFVDVAFYASTMSPGEDCSGGPVRHFCRKGWRQGRDPSPHFSTNGYLATYPDIAECGINPLWHFVTIGRAEGRSPCVIHTDSASLEALRAMVDPAFYLEANLDIAIADIDPFLHYVHYGHREERLPNTWFDPEYYAASDQALATSLMSPFKHYADIGARQGRSTHDPRLDIAQILGSLQSRTQHSRLLDRPISMSTLDIDALTSMLVNGLDRPLMVLSLSHDAYTKEVGGIQTLIFDEQKQFEALDATYLHLSPVLPRLHFVDRAEDNPLRVTLNGEHSGFVDCATLHRALAILQAKLPIDRVFICHCLLGHDLSEVQRLHAILQPTRSFFWLHDFSSVCEGYTLLRNDLEFCGAPEPESLGCRVCVHGAGRARHLRAIRILFEAVAFEVLAPSASALETWRSAVDLPHRAHMVVPHAKIEFDRRRRRIATMAGPDQQSPAVRVAFIGHPATHKGWSGFRRVVKSAMHDPAYSFFHFGVQAAASDLPVRFVETRVSAQDRDAMRRALEEHAIDLVLVLSPWPETFSFVTYEAIAAGADVVTLRGSGNVAAEVLRSGRGVVFADMEAVREFFTSRRAVDYVELSLVEGNPGGRVCCCGTTASVISQVDARTGDGNGRMTRIGAKAP